MSAKSPEARKLLRELDKELAQASAREGKTLVWSAAETAVLGQISSMLDRKYDLLELYGEAAGMKTKLRLSSEVRLLEQGVARLLREIKTDLPAAGSLRSVKARRAARARWDRGSDAGS